MSKISNNKILVSLVLGLFIMLILGLGATIALMPNEASADTPGYYKPYSNHFVDTSYDPDDNFEEEEIDNPRPEIYYIDPNSVESRRESMRVTVSGANFMPESIVRFDGSYRPTRFDSSSKLTVSLSSSDMSNLGVHVITVFTPNGGTSNGEYMTIERDGGAVLGASTNKNTNPNTYVTNPPRTNGDESPIVYNDYQGEFGDLTANAFYGNGSFLPNGILQWIMVAILVVVIIIMVRKFFGPEKNYHSTPLKHS